MWETRSLLAWVGFAALHGLGRAEPAPLDLMPPNSHLPTDIAVGTTTVLLPVIVWVLSASQFWRGWLPWLEQGWLRMVTQLCHSPCGFLQSLPPCYCKKRTIFPYGAAVLQYQKGSFLKCWWKAGDLQDISCMFVPVSDCW